MFNSWQSIAIGIAIAIAIALLYNRLVELKNCSEVHQWGAFTGVSRWDYRLYFIPQEAGPLVRVSSEPLNQF